MVKARPLAERQHCILKVHAYDGRGLICQFLAHGCGSDGRDENEAFEGPQADTVRKPHEVEVTEYITLAFVDALAEAVREEWVAGEALGFLYEQAESEGGGCFEGRRRSGGHEPCLRVHDKSSDKVEVGADPMLLRQLRVVIILNRK